MPELPEVETVRRGLALKMSGRRILQAELRRPDLRRPFPPALAKRLDGARIGALGRRGKYILIELDSDGVLLLHLGMSGRVTAGTAALPDAPHDHVVLRLDDGTVIRFNDARRFGLLDYIKRGEETQHPLLAGLGPEPLEAEFNGEYLTWALAGKMTIKWNSNALSVARTRFISGPAAATNTESRFGLRNARKLTGTGLA